MRPLAAFTVCLMAAAALLAATRPPVNNGDTPTTPTTTTTVVTVPLAPLPDTYTADDDTPAARLPAMQLVAPPPAPTTTTIPTEPCAEMAYYRAAAGLPARFDGIGWRESGCDNTQRSVNGTGCCVGYWQIHHINFRDHRTIDRLAACDATWLNIRGDTPEAKQRQACTAKVLYDVVGYTPWALTA